MEREKRLNPWQAEKIEQYYRENYEFLLKYAWRLLHDEEKAKVAVQETFLVAVEKYEAFISSERPVGWLVWTLRYAVLAMERKESDRESRFIALEDCPSLPALQMNDPEELGCTSSDMALLNRFYGEGYTAKEMASELKLSVGAMKMRIFRAKKRLIERLEIEKLHDF